MRSYGITRKDNFVLSIAFTCDGILLNKRQAAFQEYSVAFTLKFQKQNVVVRVSRSRGRRE